MKHSYPPVPHGHLRPLLDALDGSDGLTRAGLSDASGCSLMTVCRAEEFMLKSGILRRTRERAGVSGRPAAVLRPAFPVPVLLLCVSDSNAAARLFRGTDCPSGKTAPVVTAGSPLTDVNENLRLLLQAVRDSALPALAAAENGTRAASGVMPAVLLPSPAHLQARPVLTRTVCEGLAACGMTVWTPPGIGEDPVLFTEPGEASLYALEREGRIGNAVSLALFSRSGSRLLLRRTPECPWFTPPGAKPLCRELDRLLYGSACPDVRELRRLLSLFPPEAVLAESCPPFTDAPLGALKQALPEGIPPAAADTASAVRGTALCARRRIWDGMLSPAHPTAAIHSNSK